MSKGKEIKRIQNTDGTQYVSIMVRSDGYFSFEETSLEDEDGYSFWTPSHLSGIYETAEKAEQEARAMLPWLRERNFE